jgi:inorganic triphosphatase YgiF
MALSPATTVAEAFRHFVRHCLRQLLANEDCALAALAAPGGGDLAAVRHMRYALRRLRHGLELFAPVITSPEAAMFIAQSRVLGRRLGPARNWAMIGPALRKIGLMHPTDAPPPGANSGAYRDATDRASGAILAPEFTRLVLACGGWLELERWSEHADEAGRLKLTQPITELAPPWLDHLLKRVRKAGYDSNEPEALDRLSRRLRKLFDAADGFRGLFPLAQTRAFTAALADLRRPLDDAIDLAQTRDVLALAGARRDLERDAAIERGIAEAKAQLPEAWRRFRQIPPFWIKG